MGRMMVVKEMKKVGCIAGPMVAVMLMQYLLQVASLMMVGHLGSQLALSAIALAFSFCSVSGFTVLQGMAGALETLCGQACGAQQYKRIGLLTYTAILSLSLVFFPLSLIWIFMGKLLPLFHQDPSISHEAGKFSRCLLPALFGCALLQPLVRYFQTQSLIIPLLVSSAAAFCLHLPICWCLVFKSRLRHLGAAFAVNISIWLNVIFMGLFMKFSPACSKTRAPVTIIVLTQIPQFFRLAIPSAVMLCLEYWSFELLVLLAGLLPNPKVQTSVLATCLTTCGTLYTISYGLGAAVSTRVSNELGAGNPEGARTAVHAAILMALIDMATVTTTLLASRHSFGYLFSKDRQVVEYLTAMTPLVAGTVGLDTFHGVLTGIARGCGWQKIGTYINIGAYYLFGIPISIVLGFVMHFTGKGLWSGVLVGASLQIICLAIITACTDWDSQATKAKEMVFEQRSSNGATADSNSLAEVIA